NLPFKLSLASKDVWTKSRSTSSNSSKSDLSWSSEEETASPSTFIVYEDTSYSSFYTRLINRERTLESNEDTPLIFSNCCNLFLFESSSYVLYAIYLYHIVRMTMTQIKTGYNNWKRLMEYLH